MVFSEFGASDFLTVGSARRPVPLWVGMAEPRPTAPSHGGRLSRPPPPSRRARRAHMGRNAFIWLVVGWVLAVVAVLTAALAIRLFA